MRGCQTWAALDYRHSAALRPETLLCCPHANFQGFRIQGFRIEGVRVRAAGHKIRSWLWLPQCRI